MGVRRVLFPISGVLQTSVGYANGQVETTNYQLIKETDHAETVQVVYDEKVVSLREILLYYFRVIDPLLSTNKGMTVVVNTAQGFITKMMRICRLSIQ